MDTCLKGRDLTMRSSADPACGRGLSSNVNSTPAVPRKTAGCFSRPLCFSLCY